MRWPSGGTDLIARMKDYVTSPDHVVYLRTSRTSGDHGRRPVGLTIGGGTRLSDIVAHPGIRESYPALWQGDRRGRLAQIAT
jgi:xanthine dehydrogenase YagS FAD-binding subunit